MTEHAHPTAPSVPVERLRPGDHACLSFTDVEARWQVLTAYTRSGLARGEKVLLVLDPDDLGDDEATSLLDGGTGAALTARANGRLELRRNLAVYLPDGRFCGQRQVDAYDAEVTRARGEGHRGLRVGADMAWAARAEVSDEQLLDYEAIVEPLFADRLLTAICWYDRDLFTDHLVTAVRTVHPLQVLERLDALDVTTAPGGARITGVPGPGAREDFSTALRSLLHGRPDPAAYRFELDLTDLGYMEAHCAWQLIRFAAALPEHNTLVVRCGPILETVLRGLGSDDVPQLEVRASPRTFGGSTAAEPGAR